MQQQIPRIHKQAEPARRELDQCPDARKTNKPPKPRCNSVLRVRDTGRAETVADARDGEREGKEESRDAPTKGVGEVYGGRCVVDIPADAQVGPKGAEKDWMCVSLSID